MSGKTLAELREVQVAARVRLGWWTDRRTGEDVFAADNALEEGTLTPVVLYTRDLSSGGDRTGVVAFTCPTSEFVARFEPHQYPPGMVKGA